jgi:hypothetical protein
MISCLIGLIIVVIVCLIVLYVLEMVIGSFLSLPSQIWMLIRLLVGLLVLLYALNCLAGSGAFQNFGWNGFNGPYHR